MNNAKRYVLMTAVLFLPACMTWSQSQPPGAALEHTSRQPLRIERTDHSTIEITSASVQGDSLIGTAADGSNARVSIPVSDITAVATREISPGRTLALTGGVVLGTLGALFLALIISISLSSSPLL